MKLFTRLLILLSPICALFPADQAGSYLVEATISAAPIKLDGILDDRAWQQSVELELVQQSPSPGAPTQFPTRARLLIFHQTLYIGFDCIDPAPSRIAIHTMQRDGSTNGDDTVAVVLDTYGDRRTGYYFQINAAGARVDGLISGPEHPSLDWDGIWDARTHKSGKGWTAEIAIPVQTLTFTPELPYWGLNLERRVARNRLTLRWASPTLDSFLFDLSRSGRLGGLNGMRQGKGIEVSPFVVGRMKNFFQTTGCTWQAQPGVDVTWRITPELAAVFTANTDFAETEVDSRQLNITRFPLFFPERRSFFLEGSNQFQFGLGLDDYFIPFFSRRIGLFEGSLVPIDAGLKLNGRIGKWNIGVLDTQMRETEDTPRLNLFAGRVSYDVTRELRLGAILTNGDPSGAGENTLFGFDGVWRTSRFRNNKNLLIGGWTAFSRRDGRTGNRKGYGFKIDYPNDRLDCMLVTSHLGKDLNPALGFLPRSGVRQYQGGCSLAPRPARDGKWSFIRQYRLRSYYTRYDNMQGFNESWRYFFENDIRFDSGDQTEVNFSPQHEYLPQPFEIASDVIIPVGSYRFNRFSAQFESSEHRLWQFAAANSWGSFYSGTLYQAEAEFRFTSPEGRLQAGIGSEQNFGKLREGKFVQRLWQLQFSLAFNPNLVLTSFVQYDNESENLGQNSRLRWTIKPGNDFFVVWNRGWKRLLLSPRDRTIMNDSELLAIKLRWTFRR